MLKAKVMKRSKTYFGHNSLSFRPIHMKPTPKCSFFNSLSSDLVTNVALPRVCALPSACSSFMFVIIYFCFFDQVVYLFFIFSYFQQWENGNLILKTQLTKRKLKVEIGVVSSVFKIIG